MDHTGQENIWFVGCLTTARATPASREGVPGHRDANSVPENAGLNKLSSACAIHI